MSDTNDQYDIAIVGGGIHGVGVAQAAAAAGHSVVLFEQTSLAAGTSCKSSKLIHGGLRYLETGEITLVRESLRERELLIELAPGLVRRQKFFIPVYHDTSRPPWMMRAGLTLYAVLAGLGPSVWFRKVPQREWDSLDGLTTDGLRKVYEYVDGQTDDAALTAAVMRSSQSLGAKLLCPAALTAARIDERGVKIDYQYENETRSLTANVLVNAAGPWANRVLATVTPTQTPMKVDNVQGAHIELPGRVERGCYYMEVPSDRRAVFVMPWKGRTCVGTTEHTYVGDPAKVVALDEEVRYLLDVYRKFFPGRSQEVLDQWAGLRVLPAAQGAAFKRSRETQLPVDNERQPRLLSIFGGKLTGYRATALKVMGKLQPSLPARTRKAHTSELRLDGIS